MNKEFIFTEDMFSQSAPEDHIIDNIIIWHENHNTKSKP